MTREEAYKKIKEAFTGIDRVADCPCICEDPFEDIVDEIYNNFESRICKNCKWIHKGQYEGEFWCINPKNSIIAEDGMFVNENFGCNRFERRER